MEKPFALIISLFTLSVMCACAQDEAAVKNDQENEVENMEGNDKIRYLALGDSYTIGESVKEVERWPVQLVSELEGDGFVFEDPHIIAKTGWTTEELNDAIAKTNFDKSEYDIVSLLIGVNNQYRGYHIEVFRNELAELVYQAIEFAGSDKSKVFVVSIPDYGKTPFAKSSDTEKIAKEIDAYNEVAKEVAGEFGVQYCYITDISREAENDSNLVAKDGLHPSAKMYSRWIERLRPKVIEMLK